MPGYVRFVKKPLLTLNDPCQRLWHNRAGIPIRQFQTRRLNDHCSCGGHFSLRWRCIRRTPVTDKLMSSVPIAAEPVIGEQMGPLLIRALFGGTASHP